MLTTGIKGRQETVVEMSNTAKALGSGELEVFATPAMIALIEETAWKSVAPELSEGDGTVGTKLEVTHISATPLGAKIWCETELSDIDRRKLTFKALVYDESGKIGEGTHERFIINNEKFMDKAINKFH